jgi:hypothetical protein
MLLSGHGNHYQSSLLRSLARQVTVGQSVAAKASKQPASRRNISERIEQLRRQNESLKQAIGVFLDQPQDVGVVTGQPTGAWDEGSTATLLDTLRKKPVEDSGQLDAELLPAAESVDIQDVVSEGLDVGRTGEDSSSSSSLIEPLARGISVGFGDDEGAIPTSESSNSLDATGQRSPATDTALVYDGAENLAAAEAAADDDAGDVAAAEALSKVTSSTVGYESTDDSSSWFASDTSGVVSTTQSSSSSSPSAIDEAMAAAAAVAGAAAPAPAAAAAPPAVVEVAKPPVPLGTIHERVEQMEREHQQQELEQAAKHPPAVKPRATGKPRG